MDIENRNVSILIMIVIASVFLFLSYVPNLYEASVSSKLPANRVITWGDHIFTYDYNVYLSKIRQGIEGRWMVVNKYTNDPKQPGVLIQEFYLLMGKIGGVFKLTPVLTFHLFRTIFSFIWILIIIYLNVDFLKKPRLFIPGILISLLASSFPLIQTYQGKTWIDSYMNWWQEMDVLKRISFHPHYLFNYSAIAVLIVLMYSFHKTKNLKYFLGISGVLFISLFVHPAAGITFLLAWLIFNLFDFLLNKRFNRRFILTVFLQTLVLITVVAIPILYFASATAVRQWQALTGNQIRPPFAYGEYFLALGPVFITGVLGLIVAFFKKNFRFLAIAAWFIGSILGTVIARIYPFQTEIRFIQIANQIPLAILTVYLFKELVSKFKRNLIVTGLSGLIFIFIVGLGLIHSYYSLKNQTDFINQRAFAELPLVPYPAQVMYPLADFYNGIKWLETNTKTTDVVLSAYTAGNYIPAYAGNFVYLGHAETPDEHQRVANLNQFFSGLMDHQSAFNFLKRETINYVFYGPQEKDLSQKDINQYQFLIPVYKADFVTIFKVSK